MTSAIYLKMRREASLLIWQEIIMAMNGNFLHRISYLCDKLENRIVHKGEFMEMKN